MGVEPSRVLVTARVPCHPAEAFERFTGEIGSWWRPSPLFQFSAGRTGTLALEPGVGGRLIECYDDGSLFVIGAVTIWAPPHRVALSWRHANFPPGISTELQVSFEPTQAGQTKVTVEHVGWDRLPDDHVARHGFPLPVFQLRFAEWWRALLATAFAPSFEEHQAGRLAGHTEEPPSFGP